MTLNSSALQFNQLIVAMDNNNSPTVVKTEEEYLAPVSKKSISNKIHIQNRTLAKGSSILYISMSCLEQKIWRYVLL